MRKTCCRALPLYWSSLGPGSPDSRLRLHPRTRKDSVLFRRRWRPSHPCGTQPRPQHASAPAQSYPTPQRRALWPNPQAAEEAQEAQVGLQGIQNSHNCDTIREVFQKGAVLERITPIQRCTVIRR
ncbi:uncharacterized protein LOC144297151 isoform X2 [Canis aureus]